VFLCIDDLGSVRPNFRAVPHALMWARAHWECRRGRTRASHGFRGGESGLIGMSIRAARRQSVEASRPDCGRIVLV
jgi:hypothetical protein